MKRTSVCLTWKIVHSFRNCGEIALLASSEVTEVVWQESMLRFRTTIPIHDLFSGKADNVEVSIDVADKDFCEFL